MRITTLLALSAFIGACSSTSDPPDQATKDEAAVATATPSVAGLAKKKAELLTSIWENGTTVLQYGYCENIADGRGYTSGRAGFCSGTGDAVLVVQCVAEKEKDSVVAKYLPALQSITKTFEASGVDQASTSSLDAVGSYCADWSTAAASATLRACQDQLVAELYFKPALAHAAKLGLSSALTIAALYDAEINQGTSRAADLVAKANAKVEPVSGARTIEQESAWLEAFLAVRLALLHGDPTWVHSVDRVAVYEAQRRAGNFDFSKTITTDAKASALFPGQSFADSGYPKCTIAADGAVSGDADCTNAKPAADGDDAGDDDDGK